MIRIENISFDHCIKCTVCTIYCPVARVTHLFPGPKQSGPDAERLRRKNPDLLDSSLLYCTNCKRCEIACPSDVKIADFIQQAKFRHVRRKFRLRDYLLSHTDLLGAVMTRISWLANTLARVDAVKFLLDFFLRIAYQKNLPRYAAGTFQGRYRRFAVSQSVYQRQVVYFHGCYVNYNDHQLGQAVLAVLNTLGFGVLVCREKCCGVPLIASGYIKDAKKNAYHNLDCLTKEIGGRNLKVVSSSSTCTMALKYEYPNLLQVDNTKLASRIEYITQFLAEQFDNGNLPDLNPVPLTAAYHAPCHLERMGGVIYTIDVLRRIPGLRLKILHSECCGISGTYGYKDEYFGISQDVGAALFDKIKALSPDVVITDCETCKLQIEMNTPFPVLHPVMVLAHSMGVGLPGSELNKMVSGKRF
jgi:glycerol-3-phosphate dehydrogenase subunit C